MQKKSAEERGFMKFIGGVERIGNRLPHPFMMFVWLIAFVILISVICEWLGVSASYTKVTEGNDHHQSQEPAQQRKYPFLLP